MVGNCNVIAEVPSAKRFNADVPGAQGFLSKLEGLLVYGGGDCPERAMQGILNALELVDWFSAIFVFTDAPAQDGHRKQEVIDAAVSKKTTINFFDKQDCGFQAEHAVYQEIADALDGHVVRSISNDTSLVDMVWILATSTGSAIGSAASSPAGKKSVGVPGVTRPVDATEAEKIFHPEISVVGKRSVRATTGVTIPVDATVAEMKIVASTFSVDAISMTVNGPFVSGSADISASHSFGTFLLKNPPPGNYNVSIEPADSTYTVYLDSSLYFEFTFWAEDASSSNLYLVDTPTKGKTKSMHVFHWYPC